MAGYLQHYLDQLRDPLSDPETNEVVINSDAQGWIEQAGSAYMSRLPDIGMGPGDVHDLAKQIANNTGLTLTEQQPMISTTVAYRDLRLRVQAIIPPAAADGAVLAFRVFRRRKASEEPKRFKFLRKQGKSLEAERLEKIEQLRDMAESFDVSQDADDFLRKCVTEKLNVIISGGTSTGKTEMARRMQWMIPQEERLVLIEDSEELLPQQENYVSLLADRKEGSPRSAEKLLQATLRLRPDRILVGELRGSEALTFLEAINTGHAGSFTTIHTESGRKAMDRLAFFVQNTGLNLTYTEILRYMQNSIDVVIQTGRDEGDRGIMEIYFPALDGKLV